MSFTVPLVRNLHNQEFAVPSDPIFPSAGGSLLLASSFFRRKPQQAHGRASEGPTVLVRRQINSQVREAGRRHKGSALVPVNVV